MENSSVSVRENNQVKGEKPPPQICPRCFSDNTRFCYYNNKSFSQPRYTCKNCRRLWTHGGTLRDIPVGGIGRKTKPPTIDQPSVAQVVPVETQQVNHHQPFLHGQETNDFVGSIGGSSSSSTADAAVGYHFGSLPANHGDMVFPDFNDRYRINQEEPNRPRQSFNNTKSKNRNASTRGRRG